LEHQQHEQHNPYLRFYLMVALSFIAMYILMYAMVNAFANVFMNWNQVWMAGLMAAPMGVIELLLMGRMYPNKKVNAILMGACVVAGIVFWTLIRQQTAIGDRQFLRSMIPHHGGAILMCEQASLEDLEVQKLCEQILRSQREEIAQMKSLLGR
jgi:uncharacterized protein (DUF305 family)